MAVSTNDVHNAMLSRLSTMANLPDLALENYPFTPPTDALYLAENLLPGESSMVGIGTSDSNQMVGVFQVSVYAPQGSSRVNAETWANDIAAHFEKRRLTYNGQTVICEAVDLAQGIPSDGWWLIPVSVNWRAFG